MKKKPQSPIRSRSPIRPRSPARVDLTSDNDDELQLIAPKKPSKGLSSLHSLSGNKKATKEVDLSLDDDDDFIVRDSEEEYVQSSEEEEEEEEVRSSEDEEEEHKTNYKRKQKYNTSKEEEEDEEEEEETTYNKFKEDPIILSKEGYDNLNSMPDEEIEQMDYESLREEIAGEGTGVAWE